MVSAEQKLLRNLNYEFGEQKTTILKWIWKNLGFEVFEKYELLFSSKIYDLWKIYRMVYEFGCCSQNMHGARYELWFASAIYELR